MPLKMNEQAGFTLVELVISMAIFSFLLLIIVVGFLNIAQLHDEALATDQSQNSARSAMDELVQGVRNASSVISPTAVGVPASTMCLATADGGQQIYYIDNKVLYRSDDCATSTTWTAPEPANTYALTDSGVQASVFQATVDTGGLGITEPEVRLKLTVGSNNGTTNGAGTSCLTGTVNHAFCSIVTLTSGAVPR